MVVSKLHPPLISQNDFMVFLESTEPGHNFHCEGCGSHPDILLVLKEIKFFSTFGREIEIEPLKEFTLED
jgi:hypothetical protein